MKAGVGFSNEKDHFESGKKAAAEAMSRGRIQSPCLALAFCQGHMDHTRFLRGMQTILGDGVPVVGGSAIGVITNDRLSYEGNSAAVAVLECESAKCRFGGKNSLDRDEEEAGIGLARILSTYPDDKLLLILYDSVKIPSTGPSGPVLNESSPLIRGIERELNPGIPVIGAGLIGDYGFGPISQFCGRDVLNQAVLGVMFGGDLYPYFRIMHGCTPLDGVVHTITRIEGASIFEVDGRPIVPMINEIYGNRDWHSQHPVQLLSLGVNYGERFEPPRESNYISRLITGILPDGSGISLFEPDFALGMEIQFMIRDNATMVESARKNSLELVDEILIDKKQPHFALYIDCAGRTAAYSNADVEEASRVQEALNGHGIPLLGFYSGVEVAPLLQSSRGLDWTGVLMVLAGD